MIRKAGQRLIENLKTKQSSGQRIQDARRYTRQPEEIPTSIRMTEKPAIQVGHAGISPINAALFQGDGYSAMSQ